MYAAKREGMALWVVKRKGKSIFDNCENARVFESESKSLANLRDLLAAETTSRKALIQKYCANNGIDVAAEDVYQKTFVYLRENTKAIMLIIESFVDFCTAVDGISALMFDNLFKLAQKRNIYIVSCFEPDDYKKIEGRTLYYGFNPAGNVLLMGG